MPRPSPLPARASQQVCCSRPGAHLCYPHQLTFVDAALVSLRFSHTNREPGAHGASGRTMSSMSGTKKRINRRELGQIALVSTAALDAAQAAPAQTAGKYASALDGVE